MATQRALLLRLPLEMLRNIFSGAADLSSAWREPEARAGSDPLHNKRHRGPCAGAKNSAGRAQTFMHIRLWGCKSPRIPWFDVPPPEAPVQAVILLLHQDYFKNSDI